MNVSAGAGRGEEIFPPRKSRRSGSERRQKGRIVAFRVSATEYRNLNALAARAGLTRSVPMSVPAP